MILDEILEQKRKEINVLRQIPRFKQPPPAPSERRNFADALRSNGNIRLIAEIKRRSPSKGDLRLSLDPAEIAAMYQDSGASAISVLTDENYFGGSLSDLQYAREACTIPVLRKDFIIDGIQIWHSAEESGPDAILLIAAALNENSLSSLLQEARRFGLHCLVETHNEADIEASLAAGADIIGINNRDLQTFEVNLETTERLRPLIPNEKIIVSESGIHSSEDVKRLQDLGIDAILVGEALMKSVDPAIAIKRLLGR